MNIAIDIRCLMEKELTGVGEYTFHLLKHLFEIDNKNQYYLFYNSRQDVSKYIPKFPKDNVHYCEFRWPNKLLNLSLKFFKRPKLDKWIISRHIRENPVVRLRCFWQNFTKTKQFPKTSKTDNAIDLFFFPNMTFLRTKCPHIITCHDLSFRLFPEFLSFKRKAWHTFINPRKLYKNAKQIISVSENTTNDLINYFLTAPKKIKTIPSGISSNYKVINKDDAKMKKIRKKYKLPQKFILFLGTIEPRKNLPALIAAFNAFQKETDEDYSLVIAGKLGWGAFPPALSTFPPALSTFPPASAAGRKMRAQSNIIFTDFIKDSEKRYFYNMAELFVYPSYYEGFGFPPLEAMACGCPVITSSNSSLAEVCGDAALLVDPYNVNDLTKAMKQILLDKETSEFYRQKGLERVKNFSWYNTAQKMLNLFEIVGKTRNS